MTSSFHQKKNKLVLVDLYHPQLYGDINDPDLKNTIKEVTNHYLVLYSFKNTESKEWDTLMKCIDLYKKRNQTILLPKIHPNIRNYANIIQTKNFIQPNIAQCIYTIENECVAIIKTFWIRWIQRKWKNMFRLYRQNQKKEEFKPTLHGMLLPPKKYVE